jgi:hypothetical protein
MQVRRAGEHNAKLVRRQMQASLPGVPAEEAVRRAAHEIEQVQRYSNADVTKQRSKDE